MLCFKNIIGKWMQEKEVKNGRVLLTQSSFLLSSKTTDRPERACQ